MTSSVLGGPGIKMLMILDIVPVIILAGGGKKLAIASATSTIPLVICKASGEPSSFVL